LQALLVGVIAVLVALVFYPLVAKAPTTFHRSNCLSQVKQLCLATEMYLADYGERFPHRDSWMDLLLPYHRNAGLEHCPTVLEQSGGDKNLYGYAWHSRLSEESREVLAEPAKHPMIYDSVNLGRNASDPFASLPNPPRSHRSGGPRSNNVGYADGHAKALTGP
jgi:prepilin-type processing-associated H-X9-DG protein